MYNSKRHSNAVTALQKQTGVKLSVLHEHFVYEYTTDYDHRRAAVAIGLHPDDGSKLIGEPHIAEAVRIIYNEQMKASEITPEVIKEEMYTLYNIAMQKKQYGVAAKMLDQLAKHSHIDAYAAQKVTIAADAEVARALANGRKRVNALNEERDVPVPPTTH